MIDWMTPLPLDAASEEQKKTLERARKKLLIPEGSPTPGWLLTLAHSPGLLKDAYMNVERVVLSEGKLTTRAKLVLAVATASHAGQRDVASHFAALALNQGADQAQLYEAVGIAATSASFNEYYKLRGLYDGEGLDGYSAGLRASLFVSPSQGKAMAELINLVISTINGCKSCVNGHVQDALRLELTRDQLDEAMRVGAVVMSICRFLPRG